MHAPPHLPRIIEVGLLLLACLLAAGCTAEKPVSDASTLHPNGIGLDIETVTPPVRKSVR